MKLNHKWEL